MKEATLAVLLAMYGIGWYRAFTKPGVDTTKLLLAQGASAIILLTIADLEPSLAFGFVTLELLATVIGYGPQSGQVSDHAHPQIRSFPNG